MCVATSSSDPTRHPDRTFKYVDVSAVSGDRLAIESSTQHTGRTAPSRARKHIRAGDVLFATIRPALKRVALVPMDLDGEIASTAFCVLRPNRLEVDPLFLYFAVSSDPFVRSVSSLQRGASYPAITDSNVLDQEVLLPLLPEQSAIASLLSEIQRAIALEEQQIKTIDELRAATMERVFREGVRGERLKRSENGGIPSSWTLRQLHELAAIERGKFAHRPRNDPRFYGGATPFIQTGDVVRARGRVRTHTQTLSELGLSVSRVFPKGTIVLTIAANIADTGILDFASAFPDSLVGITPREGVDTEFLEFFLRTQKSEMDRLASKGTQKNINIQFLRPWPVMLPTFGEQREIARVLLSLDARLAAAEERQKSLRELFETARSKLMTGELRITSVASSKLAHA